MKSLVSGKHPLCIITQCFLVHCMTAQITHVALKAEINCEKTLGWFSFVLKLNGKSTNMKPLLGSDKILIEEGKKMKRRL